jgi:hypothetical protein
MKHISGIIKRVLESIKVEDKTDSEAEKRERQGQWDEAMGELDAQQARYDDEAEQAGLGRAPYRGDVRLPWG